MLSRLHLFQNAQPKILPFEVQFFVKGEILRVSFVLGFSLEECEPS
jgi:hypothetical protein